MNALAHPDHVYDLDVRPVAIVPRPLTLDDAYAALARAAEHKDRHDLDEITRDAIKASA